jgi:hypothetical protein
MKTLFKLILLLILLAGLACVSVVLVFFFSSSLQRSIAVRVLEANSEGTVQLEHVKIGFGSARVRGLRLESPEQTLSVDSLEARFDTWSLFGEEPRVQSVNLAGSAQLPENRSVEFKVVVDKADSGTEATYSTDLSLLARMPGTEGVLTCAVELTPEIRLDLEARKMNLSGPIRLSGPESDTNGTLTGEFNFGNEPIQSFVIDLEADRISVDEWQSVLAMLSSAEEPPAERDPTPDEAPPWAGLDGKATVRLGALVVGGNTFTDLTLVANCGRRTSAGHSDRSQKRIGPACSYRPP